MFVWISIASIIVVSFVLILGILNLFSSSSDRAKDSQKLMRLRILTQLVAILIMTIFLIFKK